MAVCFSKVTYVSFVAKIKTASQEIEAVSEQVENYKLKSENFNK